MSKPEYLISQGLVQLFTNRYGLDIGEETKKEITRLENEFTEQLRTQLNDDFDYKVIGAQTIESIMEDSVGRVNGLPLINLDDVYYQNIPVDGTLSITRLVTDVNNFGKKELGPRLGYASLEAQIQNLEANYKGSSIAIMDIGVFEGETLLDENKGIVKLLADHDMSVKRLYLSVLNEGSRSKFADRGIELVIGPNRHDFTDGDWLEIRDLLGFDGRKIDTKPYHLPEGTHLFALYTQNVQTLAEGANIQDAKKAKRVLDLSNLYHGKIVSVIEQDGYIIKEGFINGNIKLHTFSYMQKTNPVVVRNK